MHVKKTEHTLLKHAMRPCSIYFLCNQKFTCVYLFVTNVASPRLSKGEEAHEALKNLVLSPVYWREMKMREKRSPGVGGNEGGGLGTTPNPLLSSNYHHLMSISLLFTSRNEGYLYHLPGHLRKPGRGCGVQRIATYPFTGPVSKVFLSVD